MYFMNSIIPIADSSQNPETPHRPCFHLQFPFLCVASIIFDTIMQHTNLVRCAQTQPSGGQPSRKIRYQVHVRGAYTATAWGTAAAGVFSLGAWAWVVGGSRFLASQRSTSGCMGSISLSVMRLNSLPTLMKWTKQVFSSLYAPACQKGSSQCPW